MKEKTKMKLEDIKVESFITSLDENSANALKGGTGGGDVPEYTFGPTYCGTPGCMTYGNSCPCTITCPPTWNTCASAPHAGCCVD